MLTGELVTLPAGEWSAHYSTEGYAYLHEATGKETLWASSLLGYAVYKASGGRLYMQAPDTDPAYLDELQTKNTQIAYSFRAPGYDKPFACRVVKVAVPLDISQLRWEVFHLYRQLDIGGYLGGRKAFTDKWGSWLALIVSRCGLPPSHMAKGIATMRGAAHTSEGQASAEHTMSTAAMLVWLTCLASSKGFKAVTHRRLAWTMIETLCKTFIPERCTFAVDPSCDVGWPAVKQLAATSGKAKVCITEQCVDISSLSQHVDGNPSIMLLGQQASWSVPQLLLLCFEETGLLWLLVQLVTWLQAFFEQSFLAMAQGITSEEAAGSRRKGERWCQGH